MKRRIGSLVLALCAFIAPPLNAQFRDPGWSIGGGGGVTAGQGDDVQNKLKFGGRGFLRYGFAPHFQIEVGGGFGEIGGPEYKTTLIPVDARLMVSPWQIERWNPYFFLGAGAANFKIQEGAGAQHPSGWAPFVPVGAGAQVRLSNNLSVEAAGTFSYSLIDTLDAGKNRVKGSRKDAFWTALVSLTYTFESGSTDSDNDGLPNYLEKQIGTDPNNPDSDGDGLSDGDEFYKYKTNPTKADTDGDGLSDKDELRIYKTDPRKADTDGDGLSDYDEVMKYRTDPLKADTDGDGLSDGDEVTKYHTDPLKSDTDGDGLSDYDEVMKYHTDPTKVDTDLGGVADGTEVARGTDPLNPNDDLPKKEEVKVGKRIVLEGITFKSGKADLTATSVAKLEEVYQTLRDNPEIEVEISGHTDNKGNRKRNIDLSLGRADAVKTYLVSRGIEAFRVRTRGYGPDRPIAPNSTEEGRAKNRRIEFTRIR